MRLIIIETSNSKDFFTNRLDGLLTQHLANLLKIETKLLYALDGYHLEQAVKFAASSKFNVMHLSCHGDKDGIAVTDKSNIDWPAFVELFDINNYSQGQAEIVAIDRLTASRWRLKGEIRPLERGPSD